MRSFGMISILLVVTVAPVIAAGYLLPQAAPLPGRDQLQSTDSTFRPFGWSRDGKFAWMESRFVDGRGGTEYSFFIADAVKDTTVFTLADDSFDWPEGTDDTPGRAWERSGDAVSTALAAAGIIQSPRSVVSAFPLDRSGERYTADIALTLKPDTEEIDTDHIQAYAVTLRSTSRGTKQVSRQVGVSLMDAVLEGFISSPYEPRILVVVGEVTRAFEGNQEDLRFFGAHLTVGFSK